MDIIFKTIYATGELTGTKQLKAVSCYHGGWPSNTSVLQFCLNCTSHSSAVSKHEILRIPPLLIGKEKDLAPPPLTTGAGKGVGRRKGKQRSTYC